MPEADHGSAAAKYFLTCSLVVRTRLLVLAGPNSVRSSFAKHSSNRTDRDQICLGTSFPRKEHVEPQAFMARRISTDTVVSLPCVLFNVSPRVLPFLCEVFVP